VQYFRKVHLIIFICFAGFFWYFKRLNCFVTLTFSSGKCFIVGHASAALKQGYLRVEKKVKDTHDKKNYQLEIFLETLNHFCQFKFL